jgi:ABC-2 type transport system ATP-binding protein
MNMVRGFMTDPDIIFLDEPTLGLDVQTSRHIRAFVKEWVREKPSRTVLLTTHYMMEADELCDRIAIIDNGTVLACDTPLNLKRMVKRESVVKLEASGLKDGFDLSTVKGVHGTDMRTDSTTGRTLINLILEEESALADVLSALSAAGGRLQGMQKSDPTLEDVFIALVGRGLVNDDNGK